MEIYLHSTPLSPSNLVRRIHCIDHLVFKKMLKLNLKSIEIQFIVLLTIRMGKLGRKENGKNQKVRP